MLPPEAPIGSVLMTPSDRGLDTPPGAPPGAPPGDPPGSPPGPGPGETPGAGKFPAPARGRPGRPRGAPGAPRAPPGAPPGRPRFGPIPGLYILYLYYSGGVSPPPRGGRPGCTFGLPGGLPPGGQKSAHFFGYLITLPVGTVWATFSDPPPDPPYGAIPPGWGPWSDARSSPRRTGSHYRPHLTQSAPRSVTVR